MPFAAAATLRTHTQPAAIVLMGGSAGALDTVRIASRALPHDAQAPLVIVMHLPERSDDRLIELLATDCALPVKYAEDKEPIRGGTIYVAPAGYHLLVEKTRHTFALSVDAPVHYSRPAIDVLFESACDAYGSRTVAVLLSGASDDGAAGLAAVHAAGGTTVVQNPASCEVDTMPNAALSRITPDHIWSSEEIAAGVCRFAGRAGDRP